MNYQHLSQLRTQSVLLLIVIVNFAFTTTIVQGESWILKSGPTKQFTPIVESIPCFQHCATDCAEVISLPFTLQFGSHSTTSIVVSSNGVVSLEGNISALPTNWDAATLISDAATTFPRVAVIQGQLGNNNKSNYFCTTSSCIISYEDIYFLEDASQTPMSAQAEIFNNGVVELRYGNATTSNGAFVAGIQDVWQEIQVAAPFGSCNESGFCGLGNVFPTDSGAQFYWIDNVVQDSTVASLAGSLDLESSRAGQAELSLDATNTNTSTILQTQYTAGMSNFSTLQAAIMLEASRATAAEAEVTDQISQETSQASAEEATYANLTQQQQSTAIVGEYEVSIQNSQAQQEAFQNLDPINTSLSSLTQQMMADFTSIASAITLEHSNTMVSEELVSINITVVNNSFVSHGQAFGADISNNKQTIETRLDALYLTANTTAQEIFDSQSSLATSISTNTASLSAYLTTVLNASVVQESLGATASQTVAQQSQAEDLRQIIGLKINQTISTVAQYLQQQVLPTNTSTVNQSIDTFQSSSVAIKLDLELSLANEQSRASSGEMSMGASISSQTSVEMSAAIGSEYSLGQWTIARVVGIEASSAESAEQSLAASDSSAVANLQALEDGLAQILGSISSTIDSIDWSLAEAAYVFSTLADEIGASISFAYSNFTDTAVNVDAATQAFAEQQISIVSSGAVTASEDSISTSLSIEQTRAMATEAQLNASISTFKATITSRQLAINASLQALKSERIGVEQSLQSKVSELVASTAVTDIALAGMLAANSAALSVLFINLSSAVAAETERAIGVENSAIANNANVSSIFDSVSHSVYGHIADEISRAIFQESVLASTVLSNAVSHSSTESSLAGALAAEISRALLMENALQANASTALNAQLTTISTTVASLYATTSTAFGASNVGYSTAAAATMVQLSTIVAHLVANVTTDHSTRIATEASLSAVLHQTVSTTLSYDEPTRSQAVYLLEMVNVANANATAVRIELSMATALSTAWTAETSRASGTEASLAASSSSAHSAVAAAVNAVNTTSEAQLQSSAVALNAAASTNNAWQSAAVHVQLQTQLSTHAASVVASEASIASAQQSASAVVADTYTRTVSTRIVAYEQSLQVGTAAVLSVDASITQAMQQSNSAIVSVIDLLNASLTTTLNDVSMAVAPLVDDAASVAAAAQVRMAVEVSGAIYNVSTHQAIVWAQVGDAQVHAVDASLTAETSRAQQVEASLALVANSVDSVQQMTQIQVLPSMLSTAINASESQSAVLVAQLYAEESRRLAAESNMGATLAYNDSTVSAAINTENSDLNLTRLGILLAIVQESSLRASSVGSLQTNISLWNSTMMIEFARIMAEISISRDAERELGAWLASESLTAIGVESNLAESLQNEQSRARFSELAESVRASMVELILQANETDSNSTLLSGLVLEIANAMQAEANTSAAIDLETSVAMNQYEAANALYLALLMNSSNSNISFVNSTLSGENLRATMVEASLATYTAIDVNASLAYLVMDENVRASATEASLTSSLTNEVLRESSNYLTLLNSTSTIAQITNLTGEALIASVLSEMSRAATTETSLGQVILAGFGNINSTMQNTGAILSTAIDESVSSLVQHSESIVGLTNDLVTDLGTFQDQVDEQTSQLNSYLTAVKLPANLFAWMVFNLEATICTSCEPISLTVCLNRSMLPSPLELEQLFDYRVYLLKTNPMLFEIATASNAAPLLMSTPYFAKLKIADVDDGSENCLLLTVLPEDYSSTNTATNATTANNNRRRSANEGGVGVGNVLERIGATFNASLHGNSTNYLVWRQVLSTADTATTSASTAQDNKCLDDTPLLVLLGWNALLSIALLIMVLFLAWPQLSVRYQRFVEERGIAMLTRKEKQKRKAEIAAAVAESSAVAAATSPGRVSIENIGMFEPSADGAGGAKSRRLESVSEVEDIGVPVGSLPAAATTVPPAAPPAPPKVVIQDPTYSTPSLYFDPKPNRKDDEHYLEVREHHRENVDEEPDNDDESNGYIALWAGRDKEQLQSNTQKKAEASLWGKQDKEPRLLFAETTFDGSEVEGYQMHPSHLNPYEIKQQAE